MLKTLQKYFFYGIMKKNLIKFVLWNTQKNILTCESICSLPSLFYQILGLFFLLMRQTKSFEVHYLYGLF